MISFSINVMKENKKKPAVAFVVLTWNSQQYISSCINSILRCTSIVPVVFVVDNGSTDNTPVTLKKYEVDYSEVICTLLPENFGTTISRNLALKNLPSDVSYVCILDSDTVINDQALATMIHILEQNHDIGIVGPTMMNSGGATQLSGRNFPSLGIKLRKAAPFKKMQARGAQMEKPNTPVVQNIQDVPYLLSACWLMPASTIDTVGFLDENIFYAPEDVDYCLRVWQAGLRVVRCWNAQIIHEYQRLSHKKLFSKTNKEHLKGLVYYFKKHHYLFDSSKALNVKIGS